MQSYRRRGRDDAPPSASITAGNYSGVCTLVIGSMTQALTAQSVLAEAAIRASIVKISSSRTQNGCAYGVEYPCTQQRNVAMILERSGVRVREYMK